MYLDASGSMRGFVSGNANSRYVRFIQDLQLSFLAAWPQSNIESFRFGSTIQPIPENPFTAASRVSFYSEPQTRIDLVLRALDPRFMMIIITDLFQNSSDVVSLVQSLRAEVFQKNLAVGIWGLRSEFSGTVYTIGPNNRSFAYRTTSDPKSFRPFYMIVIGLPADLRAHADQVSRVSQAASRENFVLLSTHVLEEPLSWTRAEVRSIKGAAQNRSIVNCETPVGAFRLSRNRDLSLEVEIPFLLRPFIPDLDLRELPPVGEFVRIRLIRSDGVQPAESLLRSMKLRLARRDDKVLLEVSIPAAALRESGIYAFEISPTAKGRMFALPSWIAGWDLSMESVLEFEQAPHRFDGSRTLNFLQFVRNLWEAMLAENQQPLGRIHIYIQKKDGLL